jgi:prepilin-type N-terminal cleavage/methylation domain-containing protein
MTGGRSGGAADRGTVGFTLVELMVVLVLLGVLVTVSVTAIPSLRETRAPSLAERLAQGRRQALATGHTVTVSAARLSVSFTGKSVSSVEWQFMPDGRALGPGLDPRNGRLVDSSLAAEHSP